MPKIYVLLFYLYLFFLSCTKILSSSLDQLSLEPCSFNNLKSLKIDTVLMEKGGSIASIRDRLTSIPVQVRNYFLAKSPSAIFVIDYPQVKIWLYPDVERTFSSWINNFFFFFWIINLLLLKVPPKRSKQHVNDDAMAKKVTKLEAENKQPETTTEEKRILEAKIHSL